VRQSLSEPRSPGFVAFSFPQPSSTNSGQNFPRSDSRRQNFVFRSPSTRVARALLRRTSLYRENDMRDLRRGFRHGRRPLRTHHISYASALCLHTSESNLLSITRARVQPSYIILCSPRRV